MRLYAKSTQGCKTVWTPVTEVESLMPESDMYIIEIPIAAPASLKKYNIKDALTAEGRVTRPGYIPVVENTAEVNLETQEHFISTEKGDCGLPIIIMLNNVPYCVGIHSRGAAPQDKSGSNSFAPLPSSFFVRKIQESKSMTLAEKQELVPDCEVVRKSGEGKGSSQRMRSKTNTNPK
jgi:hypothetical protein